MLVPSLSLASAKGWSGLERSPQYNNPFPINDIQFLYSVKEAVDFISSKNWVELSQRAGGPGKVQLQCPSELDVSKTAKVLIDQRLTNTKKENLYKSMV
jgi:hypothetical protein